MQVQQTIVFSVSRGFLDGKARVVGLSPPIMAALSACREILGTQPNRHSLLVCVNLRTYSVPSQIESRIPRSKSRGPTTPDILSHTELTAGRTVSHGKAVSGFPVS